MKPSPLQFWFFSGISLCCLLVSNSTTAQIIPDNALPENSVVTPQGDIIQIDGGSRAGDNLFHSFEEFSVPTDNTAFFNNAVDIQNIFSRVTGGSISEIDGIIQANGTANLFLLNPSGIIFGPNASLDIGGSFFATTAESVHFDDGTQFSATATQTQPLLTVSVPIGLGFGEIPGNIVNQSIAIDNNSDFPFGLRVQPGKTLGLVGGEVVLEGRGTMTAEGGRIELGSVAGNNLVSLTPIVQGWTLDYKGIQNFQDINLSQEAFVDTSGDRGGDIQIQGRNVTLTESSIVISNTFGAETGGTLAVNASESVELSGDFTALLTQNFGTEAAANLTIDTKKLTVQDGAFISTSTFTDGRAGDLRVSASESIELIGFGETTRSSLFAQAEPESTGDAGNLTIETQRLIALDGAAISSSVFGDGNGGDLTINASDSILLSGAVPGERFRKNNSGVFASVQPEATGNGGELNITTGTLIVEDLADVSADTESIGDAGNATLNVNQLIVRGGGRVGVGSFGGSVGKSGTLTINASESVEVIGTGPMSGEIEQSFLFAQSQGEGNAGNLIINTRDLTIQDGAQVSVSATGEGEAGSLFVEADSIHLDNGSLRAETREGDQGNITLDAQDIILRRGSDITTNAILKATGGNITINTDILAALEDSNITARAIEGRGGNIRIITQGIFLSPDSEINASSEEDIDGTVTITTPEVDPTSGILELPSTPIDAESLIAQNHCAIEEGKIAGGSSFVITGRGGLPPSSDDPLPHASRVVEWASRSSQQGNSPVVLRQRVQANQQGERERTYPVIEQAQGWMVAPDGTILLTATPSNVIPQSSGLTHPHCRESFTLNKGVGSGE